MTQFLTVLVKTTGAWAFGAVIFVAFHHGSGLVANLIAGGDEERMQDIQNSYMKWVFRIKDVLFTWALGAILFILIGWI